MSPTFKARMIRRLVAYFPFTLIVLAIGGMTGAASFYFVQRTSNRIEESQRLTTAQVTYSINRSVCGFVAIADDQISRSRKALADPRSSAGVKARSRLAIVDAERFKRSQVTVPASFKCRTLAKEPPRP